MDDLDDIEKCELSFTHHGETVTLKKEHSEIKDTDFMEMVEKLVFNVGFSRKNIEQYIIEWGKELHNKRQL